MSPLDDAETKQTHYRVFVGTDTPFDPELTRKRRFPECITDGTSNTILVPESAESVPWPQPKELLFRANGAIPELGHPKRTMGLLSLCDGSVKPFDKKTMDQETLRALITANDGIVTRDW